MIAIPAARLTSPPPTSYHTSSFGGWGDPSATSTIASRTDD
jgi:hypothetical protein